MYVVVGLGNPGYKYDDTRHNIGFAAIDLLCSKYRIELAPTKFDILAGTGQIAGKKAMLIKPISYMNLSGEALRPFLDYFKLSLDQVVLIYDDLDLPVGKIRLRLKGGAGGHNGVRSIIRVFGTEEFQRIRVGIDRPASHEVARYVLQTFTPEQLSLAKQSLDKVEQAIVHWIKSGFTNAMNQCN